MHEPTLSLTGISTAYAINQVQTGLESGESASNLGSAALSQSFSLSGSQPSHT